MELLSTWLWPRRPGPYASLSPGFATAAGPDAGCCAGVGLGRVKEHQETIASIAVVSCLYCSFLNSLRDWSFLINLNLEYLNKMNI